MKLRRDIKPPAGFDHWDDRGNSKSHLLAPETVQMQAFAVTSIQRQFTWPSKVPQAKIEKWLPGVGALLACAVSPRNKLLIELQPNWMKLDTPSKHRQKPSMLPTI
jgi:hypothetical protein